MIPQQLDLFEPINQPEDLLKKQIETLVQRQENLRRGLFARHSELVKMVIKQNEEIERLRIMLIKQIK